MTSTTTLRSRPLLAMVAMFSSRLLVSAAGFVVTGCGVDVAGDVNAEDSVADEEMRCMVSSWTRVDEVTGLASAGGGDVDVALAYRSCSRRLKRVPRS